MVIGYVLMALAIAAAAAVFTGLAIAALLDGYVAMVLGWGTFAFLGWVTLLGWLRLAR